MHEDYSTYEGCEGLGRDGIHGEIPDFAPGREWAHNPNGFAGARLLCLAGGRQIHFVAETLLRRAKVGDEIVIFAYSFVHPTIISEIIDAVHRGATVSVYMDYNYLLGESKSKYGSRRLAEALRTTARAR